MVPVLLGVMTVVFVALRLIPGDPAIALAGEKASAAEIEQMRENLGLNRPLPVQYVEFLGRTATFQLGKSIRTGGAISTELLSNFAPTIELAYHGIGHCDRRGLADWYPGRDPAGTPIEYVMMVGSLVGVSMPSSGSA